MVNTTQAENFIRSATAPLMRAVAMMAKADWKATKTNPGMVPTSVPMTPVESEVLGGVADKASPLRVTEGHRVTADHPEDADGPHRNDVHHEHVEHALGSHHTAVEEGEHRCHEQHQGRAGEHPGGVAGIDLKQWCHGVNRHLAALRNRLVGVTDM